MPPFSDVAKWLLIFLVGMSGWLLGSAIVKAARILVGWPGPLLVIPVWLLVYLFLYRAVSQRALYQTLRAGLAFGALYGMVYGSFVTLPRVYIGCSYPDWTTVDTPSVFILDSEAPGAWGTLTKVRYSRLCTQSHANSQGEEVVELTVLGVLENRGTLPIEAQRIEYQSGDARAAWLYPDLTNETFPPLPSGRRVAFAARLAVPAPAAGQPLHLNAQDFALITRPVTGDATASEPALTLVDADGVFDWLGWVLSNDPFPPYTLSGHVRNDGQGEVCGENAYVALFDAGDRVVSAGDTWLRIGNAGCLAPGATAPFTFSTSYSYPLPGLVDHYEVWFQSPPTWQAH